MNQRDNLFSHRSSEQNTPPGPVQTGVRYFQQLVVILLVGGLLATVFTAWTPASLVETRLVGSFPNQIATMISNEDDEPAGFPTPTPRPRPRIGIVSGHWGNDPGAVCSDGLTEAQVNLTIATLVKQQLNQQGFDVDLLQEFDPRLSGYRGLALVSIHNDSCNYVNDLATGYKVAAALSTTNMGRGERLTACLQNRYGETTGMSYHAGSITSDMTDYHAFDEINPETTAAIIETGFLNLDRKILTEQPELVATGITQGILCFIYNEDISP